MKVQSSALLRLKLRDLAAGAAFASIAVSGSVPIWATLIFAVGVLLALLDLRVLNRYPSVTAALLGVAALLLYASVASGRLDLVVAACAFAALVTICRVLATPDARTDGQVYLTSLLMIAGGAALSGEMLFAFSLAAFALLAMLSLGMSVIERSAEPGEAFPERSFLRQLSLGATCALVGGALFFASLPRFSWNLAARRLHAAVGATAGFSDRVSLSGDGKIKTNPRIVARVKISPDPDARSLQAYWLGRTWDTFNGREWQARGARGIPQNEIELRSARGRRLHQTIELLPAYGSRTLFALQWPVSYLSATARTVEGNHRVALIELRGQEVRIDEVAPAYSYEVDSVESLDDPETLASHAIPARLLQLPPNLDSRLAALARVAAGDAREPTEIARNLERYLKSNYRYTLELPGSARDPLADFLFTRKAGHCEQFATALTVLLRSLGIPARLATGFFGGERIGDHYIVRAGDAHAWTQLVLPDSRPISLDATPEESRAVQQAALLDWFLHAYETLDERWRSSVVDYSLQDQEDLAQRMARVSAPSASWRNGALLLIGCGLAALWWWRSRRRRGALYEATAMLEAAERILVGVGLRVRGGECIEDIARRLAARRHPLSAALSDVTLKYLQARFGRRPLRARESAHLIRRLAAAARNVERQHHAGIR